MKHSLWMGALLGLAGGSASTDVLADSVRVDTATWFKRSAVDSTTLAAADKCWVGSNIVLAAGSASGAANGHYRAILDNPIPGCAFSDGYFFTSHVAWVADPVAPAANPAQVWYFGSLGSNEKVADDRLGPLSLTLGGSKFWKSNNPEIYYGSGWLMQNSRSDAIRGGTANPLSGCFPAYFFHINQSGGTAYLHLLASNPQSGSVTVSAKGSAYSNSTKPLTGKATGQSYAVSKDWRDATFLTNFSGRSVGAGQVTEIAKLTMAPSNMGDGRFDICASAGVYLYTVITTSGTTTDAINKSQGSPASGEIRSTSPTAFGREAGVYRSSDLTGLTNVVLPAGSGQVLGLAFNTTAKYNSQLQEQTAAFDTRLSDSADRTYGNYGHKADLALRLFNTSATTRRVRLSFASSFTAASNSPSFTFNSAGALNGAKVDLYTTPTQPRQVLATYTLAPGSHQDARLLAYIAGLGVTNQQLVLETID